MDDDRWEKKLEQVQDQAVKDLEYQGVETLMFPYMELIRAAMVYWQTCTKDVDDFCIQCIGSGSIVFGGTNRLIWSPHLGFYPDQGYCNQQFIENAERIGPCPGRKPRELKLDDST